MQQNEAVLPAERRVPSPAPAQMDPTRWLDLALEETFPASDPVAAHRFD